MHVSGHLLDPELAGQSQAPLRQEIPQTLSLGNHLDQVHRRLGVAPTWEKTAQVTVPDDPFLEQVVCQAQRHARADSVQSVAVAQVVHVAHRR